MITALAGAPPDAARALLGRRLTSRIGGRATAVVITEVEAYGGADDPASHAFRGRTVRNAAMYGPPGTLYVYRSYGIHWCLNIVCGPEGVPGAVLVRAGSPVDGQEAMEERRGRSDHVADGPGKLCQALGLEGSLNGVHLDDGPVDIGARERRGPVAVTGRIGISRGTEVGWRFVLQAAATG